MGVLSFVLPLLVEFISPISEKEQLEVLHACGRALQDEICEEVSEKDPSKESLRASVEYSESEHVLIEIRGEQSSQQIYASRELLFSPVDAPSDRAHAIGLTLGILAGTLRQAQRKSLDKTDQEALVLEKRGGTLPAGAEIARPLQAKDRALSPPVSRSHVGIGAEVGADYSPSLGAAGPAMSLLGAWKPYLHPIYLLLRIEGARYRGSKPMPHLNFVSGGLGLGFQWDWSRTALLRRPILITFPTMIEE